MIVFILLASLIHTHWQKFPLSKEKFEHYSLFRILLRPQTSPASTKKNRSIYSTHPPEVLSKFHHLTSLISTVVVCSSTPPNFFHPLLALMSRSPFPFGVEIPKAQTKLQAPLPTSSLLGMGSPPTPAHDAQHLGPAGLPGPGGGGGNTPTLRQGPLLG